ncbi:MAG: BREX-1 system adenine-specific DNA-methyltransferase PglX [Bacteroidaceae bacterium]|nr:BREX-1 system adenine-specific DNA-methyltransferase PglX [Bacteroidaceae bacterium]
MKLINHVLDIRRLIQQAFDNRFSRMGLRASEPVPAEQLSADQQPRRRQLDDIMQSHLSELGGYTEARQAAINECVFTLFNRIAAIKVMESKELFPEIITRRKENAGRSFEHNAWLEEHPEERNAEREGLKHFLTDQFDKLGEHIPLYRKDYPYALMPTADELNEIIEQFNAVEEDADCGADVWRGDDILGWLYENFNTVEKEVLKQSGEKTEYNKVSLQSQVYTPQWVVKFLVDNTLGKAYLEMFPDSRIKEKYQIANAPKEQVRHPKDIRQMRLLDPACGSGNFLIYAFSLFYDLYIDQMENYERDYSRRDIPKMIVENNLFGVDLDERAAQISQIALFIKARVLGGHRSHWPEYTNVVSTHFFLPEYEELQGTFEILGSWSNKQIQAIENIWNDLCSAYKFGSLVRVEERLNEMMPNDTNHSLFKEFEMESLFDYKNNVITQLRNNVNKWGGQGSNAYTLSKTNDAISFLDIISHNYDVVVANPPYTDSADFGPELKTFIEGNYKKPYKFSGNLYSCFIKRCYELSADDGKVGIIHPHTFMYIKTFEDVREFLVKKTHINVLVDYGLDRVNLFGPGILLNAAFYTFDKSIYNEHEDGVYFHITVGQQEKFKKDSLLKALDDVCLNLPNNRVYYLEQKKLEKIKSMPIIFWISDEFREKFTDLSLSDIVDVKQGIATSNNNRFCRFWWEVLGSTRTYYPYSKGGDYNKWYGNLWLYVDWSDSAKKYIEKKGRLQNKQYYFKEGITYSGSSGEKGTSFRIFPKDCLFDVGGSCIFPTGKYSNRYYILAFLNTKTCFYLANSLNPTVNTQVGDIQRVPFVKPDAENEQIITDLAKCNIHIKEKINTFSLIEKEFVSSPISREKTVPNSITDYYVYENALNTHILLNEALINLLIFSIYDLNEKDQKMVFDKEGIPVGLLSPSEKAKNAYMQWLQQQTVYKPSERLLEFINNLGTEEQQESIDDFDSLYQNNKGWEEFCILHSISPIELWYQFKGSNINPSQRTQIIIFELLTDVIRTVLAKDDDGIIPLGDKVGEERLAIRIEREMMERGYTAAQFAQVCNLLGCPLEKYLQERFFQQLSDHLNLFMYLPKTPFIWHLTSGEHHAIELYISIYKWNRDALFRVRSIYAANREAAIRDRLNSIDTSNTEGRLEANELRAMLTELQEFCQKVDDLLASGYDPKLDDGVGKNIAPLQKRKMLSYEVLNAGQLKKYLNADW